MTGLEILFLVLAILGLAVAITATAIILCLRPEEWRVCFPRNSWPIQVMFCAGTVLIFTFNVICRFTGWPPQAMQHLPFAACFATLLMNELNLLLIHAPERSLVLGAATLSTMTAFCTIIGPIVTMNVYSVFFRVSHYDWRCLNVLNGSVTVSAAVPCAHTAAETVELFNAVTAYPYSYAYYLLSCAALLAFFATTHRSVYSNYLTMTVVASWTLWTTNWCLRSIAPTEGLILTNGFLFLALYLVPHVAVFCYVKRKVMTDGDYDKTGVGPSGLPDVTLDCGGWRALGRCCRRGGEGGEADNAYLVGGSDSGGT
ncbi:G protein-coupled receptor-6.2 [Elephant endotheliotropic herpesvirus 3A]|uniref:G protein-coupled receptor-6.2 n=1 Tax=Elephant endotheliotropic herpesvirus 3A TaxID=1329409 RepID=A0A866VS39_9BETA|nr:G protein-coupled receptor-6.2 [Elephant endotheliotropic herpesvirus 3A]QOE74359.1 G protein-coupled receptor-6.2 [Elephant endotheliotropic herpesvirus 3A]